MTAPAWSKKAKKWESYQWSRLLSLLLIYFANVIVFQRKCTCYQRVFLLHHQDESINTQRKQRQKNKVNGLLIDMHLAQPQSGGGQTTGIYSSSCIMKASQLIDLIVWYNYDRIHNQFSELGGVCFNSQLQNLYLMNFCFCFCRT